ncbi:hypothetical protein MGYG_04632 [Nannizzia gypsea CBS 118893]|uniref:Uncharacterized protein n=1 Tax=Arthroderma gypseum (strain ATCC MYA-4604 / CBS 118893) TaxID=535722 RepID=E4UU39_ARTGP|nr:hypothetical protein MGYG_04632 [Nannizzia gypsea CBS 118893]EFR01629.1 hypothetical protein MGYG_04632 [Nannizzia gypsea CBS 118893]
MPSSRTILLGDISGRQITRKHERFTKKVYLNKDSDFAKSYKTFKRIMPTFAWEVIEVYSGPPMVVFKWRHWGQIVNNYIGVNEKGDKVTVKAHNGPIDIKGIVIIKVNNKLQIQSIKVWQNPIEIFRQIAKNGDIIITPRADANITSNRDEGEEHISACPITY